MNPLLRDDRARRAALATVEGRRAAHALALAEPMVGCAFVGEHVIVSAAKVPTPLEWYGCQYGTALLRQRDPAFAGDLSHLRAAFDLFGTVEFSAEVRCRKTKAHPDGLKWIVVASVALPQPRSASVPATADVAWGDLRTGGRRPPVTIDAPSAVPALPPATSATVEGQAS